MKLLALLFTLISLPAEAADWQARDVEMHYAISGAAGPELYAAIGEAGPLIGQTRVIAHTNWDLKWSRKYVPEGSVCVLKSAKPFLTITTTLPKPTAKLAAPAARFWQSFIDGIVAHESVHAADIRVMVDGIIAATVGLVVHNDPGCKLIRAEVQKLVTEANEVYKARSRAFDRAEMADGGNVHQLILRLVNGR